MTIWAYYQDRTTEDREFLLFTRAAIHEVVIPEPYQAEVNERFKDLLF